jgi:hypothetical protein
MTEDAPRWGWPKRLGFLFLFLFLGFNTVPALLESVPVVGELANAGWTGMWAALMPTLGNAALGIAEPIVVQVTGSGDMTWHYVALLWTAVVSAAGAAVWAALDRRRRGYAVLHAWLRVLVRYTLAGAMIGYGLAKVLGLQFGDVSPFELTRTYGESSPMGLVWTFMGYSLPYRWFTGLAEAVGGALLLARRTTTLGALLTIAVMANVVALNFCYDIPVKLYSSTLLLMAVFLVAPDAGRLLDLLVRGRAVALTEHPLPPTSPRGLLARRLAKAAYLLLLGVGVVMGCFAAAAYGGPKPPLYGLWSVEAFALDGAERPPLRGDAGRWDLVFVGEQEFVMIQSMSRERSFAGFAHDPAAGTVTLTPRGEGEPRARTLTLERPADGRLVLSGTTDAGELRATLQRVDTDASLLMSRGFRWVQEVPFNR